MKIEFEVIPEFDGKMKFAYPYLAVLKYNPTVYVWALGPSEEDFSDDDFVGVVVCSGTSKEVEHKVGSCDTWAGAAFEPARRTTVQLKLSQD